MLKDLLHIVDSKILNRNMGKASSYPHHREREEKEIKDKEREREKEKEKTKVNEEMSLKSKKLE